MKIFDPVYAFKNIGLLMLAASSGGGNTVQRSHARSTDMAPAPHNPAALNNLTAEHFLPVTSRAAHRASKPTKNTFTSAKSTSKSAKRASRSAKDASTSVKHTSTSTTIASTSAATISTSTTTVRHSDCEVHSAANNQGRELADEITKLSNSTKKDLVPKIAAKLTPFSGINEIDALLLPKINWPTSLNLKYCMYSGKSSQVQYLAIMGLLDLYELSNITPPNAVNYQEPTAQAQQAIHKTVAALNKNTPFQFSQVTNESEADIIFINSNLTNLNAYGLTYGHADDFLWRLREQLSFTSRQDLEDQIKGFNRNNAKKIILLFDKQILDSTRQANRTDLQKGDLYHNTILHELLHTIGFADLVQVCHKSLRGFSPTGRKELNCELPNQYAKETTNIAAPEFPFLTSPRAREVETTQYPPFLQPFDYGAINFIAENIACEESNHTQGLTKMTQQEELLYGDTTYRFTSDRWVEILDRRCQALNQTTMQNDASNVDTEGSGQPSESLEKTTSNCETQDRSVHLGDGHIQQTWTDPRGIDTYDFSALNVDLKVDLGPGEATIFNQSALAKASGSSTVKATGNLYQPVMRHTEDYLIENVKTGSGNDVVYGNQADNFFDLGSSTVRDNVTGDAGRDTFHVSAKTGNLYIADFQAGAEGDKLSLDPSFNITNLIDLRSRASNTTIDNTPALKITLDDNRYILLANVTEDELHADNLMICKHPT